MYLTTLGTICVALGTIGLAAPASASTSASPAASWMTHIFQVTYDGSGDVRYHAEGPNGDTGHFSCTAKDPLLFAVPNPQMKVIRKGKNLLARAVAFADGFWSYGGSDTIPSDKLNGGCAVYSDTSLTFGAGIFMGSDSITKITIPVKELANLAKHHQITAPVHFGKNTLHPKQTKCTADFGAPNKCVIHSQVLNAKFTLTRIK